MRKLDLCNLCGGQKFAPYAVSLSDSDLHRTYVKCRECGVYFAYPMAEEQELIDYYSRSYFHENEYHTDAATVRKRAEGMASTISLIHRYANGKRLLEIGCASGAALLAARDAGFDVVGLELGTQAVELAVKTFGLNVMPKTLEAAAFPTEEFDIVFAWHVIEHVPDLANFLVEIRRILKPRGVFIFGTENYRALLNLWSRALHLLTGSLPGLDTSSEHTYMLTPRVIRTRFPKFGYRVDHLRVYEQEREFFRSARSTNPLKKTVQYCVLGTLYAASKVMPVGRFLEVVLTKI